MMEAFGYYIAGSNPAPSANAEGRVVTIPVSRLNILKHNGKMGGE